MAIAVNFNDLGLTLKDIPRFGVAGASLLNKHMHVHTHTCIYRIQSLAHSPFRVAFFLIIWLQQPQPYPSENELLRVWQNGVQCRDRYPVETGISEKLWTNSMLIWQKWDGLLADTSESTKNTATVRKVSLTCKWTFLRSCICKIKLDINT